MHVPIVEHVFIREITRHKSPVGKIFLMGVVFMGIGLRNKDIGAGGVELIRRILDKRLIEKIVCIQADEISSP